MGRGGGDLSRPRLGAAFTRHGALRPVVPPANFTVDRASKRGARFDVFEVTTGLATIGDIASYSAGTSDGSATTSDGAATPGTPVGELAIDGAS